MKHLTRTLGAILFAALVPGAASAQTRGMTPEDYFAVRAITDARISPDGTTVAFVVTSVDQQENRRRSEIRTIALDGSGEMVLTTAPQSSNSPRWKPDGTALAFLSSRPVPGETETPRNQVWLLPMRGGEPRRLTHLLNGASAFQWSPDGTKLVVVGSSGPLDEAKSPSDVRHYTGANYKFNDTGWFDDKRTHLWVVDIATSATTQVTSGDRWNDTDPQWSPDSRRLAFVSDRSGKAADESRDTDVWVISASGGPLTKLSDHDTADDSPRWSPDGQTIAFVSAVPKNAHPQIWLAPSTGGIPSKKAADGLDAIPTALRWDNDGRSLWFEEGFHGTSRVSRVDLAARKAVPVATGERTVRSADVSSRAKRLVYIVNDPIHPDELYASDLDGRNERQLTRVNDAVAKQLSLVSLERIAYKGAEGWNIDGFFMKPVGWTAGKSYPMVLTIHGGPAGQYGFDFQHEFQMYAARGWAVFFANPRGSTGYGEKFERGIDMNWGGNDYVDVMNGVDAALATYPWIDRERLGVTGGSYGGYLTNWIISHTTMFKAAVTLRSISNFISDDGTRDGAYGHQDDFRGDIFENFNAYWNASPLKYAMNVKTPTLVLHSDMDFRVPIEQGEQWFRALRHFGVTSEIVFFPRENHNLTRTGEPKHLVESIGWQVYWFDRFLNGNAAAVPPDAPVPTASVAQPSR